MGNAEEKQANDNNHFYEIKSGLMESMININKTLNNIKDWDELINLKEVSIEDKQIKRTKTIKQGCSINTKRFCIFCGALSCIIQLIGVQASIIILNSLFDEIVEEFKLWLSNTPRIHNFYESLEINSYRELPEIDVGMITSSVGIIILKNSGFVCSNICFQLLSSIWFLLLLLLFEFHIKESLLENYTRLEIVVLILSYVGLSFLVGCSTTIALKEFSDKYYDVYIPADNKKTEENEINGKKLLFFLFPAISIIITIMLNRIIFISFKEKTSKWILKWISIICFISFGLSMIFYFFYTIPITTREKIKKQEKKDKNNLSPIRNNNILSLNIIPTENEEIKIYNDEIPVKFNQSFPQNKEQIEEIRITKTEKIKDKEIYSTKICTLCGYIYLERRTDKKQTCFFHYYTKKTTWFYEKVCNAGVILTFFILLYCQVISMGFSKILKEKLLSEFTFTKTIKFYCALFIFSQFFGIIIIYKSGDLIKYEKKLFKSLGVPKCCCDCYEKNIVYYLERFSIFIVGFIIFTFISSFYYFNYNNNLNAERWNNIIMAEFICFKIIDFQFLTFFNFFDNSDLFNTTLAITFEKLFWMIIETIINSLVESKKWLILVQLILSSIFVGMLAIFIFLFLFVLCCPCL